MNPAPQLRAAAQTPRSHAKQKGGPLSKADRRHFRSLGRRLARLFGVGLMHAEKLLKLVDEAAHARQQIRDQFGLGGPDCHLAQTLHFIA